MLNPAKVIMECLVVANARSVDPRMTYVNLLTAAVVAGKIIGQSQQDIRKMMKQVEGPAAELFKAIEVNRNANSQGEERPRSTPEGDAPAEDSGGPEGEQGR